MNFRLKDIGSSLGTRELGANIRSEVEVALSEGIKISFDFDGVKSISNSFADECFGKLLFNHDIDTIMKSISFSNANVFVKTVIVNSFKQREVLA